jgi:predicted MFS family arabinose efflux permease
LLALAAGLGVANLYYAQPLAETMARSFSASAAAIGLCLMNCQLGYALGMLLLVPLGDARERRALMVATSLAASLALLLVATAPSYPVLFVTCGILGFSSCLPQMAVPFAVTLVGDEMRGRAIGVVMGGLLTGILLSRVASGLLASVIGWRWTLASAAGSMALLAAGLRFGLPSQRPREPLLWGGVIRSLPSVLSTQPLLRRHALMGALGFGSFSAFWSTLSFHLAELGHGERTAGAFGVLGLVGVAAAPIVGRLSGRIPPTSINAAGHLSAAFSFGLLWLGQSSLVGLLVGTVVLDAGTQSTHLANQTVILGLKAELRNRINAIYMVSFFAGGALGTGLAALAWQLAGFGGVCAVGALLALAGTLPLVGYPREQKLG